MNDNIDKFELSTYPADIQSIIEVLDLNAKPFFFDLYFNEESLDTGQKKISGRMGNTTFFLVCNGYVIARYKGKTRVFDHSDIDRIRVLNKSVKFPTNE